MYSLAMPMLLGNPPYGCCLDPWSIVCVVEGSWFDIIIAEIIICRPRTNRAEVHWVSWRRAPSTSCEVHTRSKLGVIVLSSCVAFSTTYLCLLLPSLENHRIWAPRIYDAHKGSAVLFGVHKHNERDNFMSPYAGFLCIYTPQSKKQKKCHTRNSPRLGDKVTHMHVKALIRNASASKHSQPCSMWLLSSTLHQHHTRIKKIYQICSCRNWIFVQLHKTPTMRK